MGFTSGLAAGLSLPLFLSTLFLTQHRASRTRQSHLLSQQHLLLNSVFDPAIVPLEDAPQFVLRRETWSDGLKERWNREVEGLARLVTGTGGGA